MGIPGPVKEFVAGGPSPAGPLDPWWEGDLPVLWKTTATNWYKIFGYQFKVLMEKTDKDMDDEFDNWASNIDPKKSILSQMSTLSEQVETAYFTLPIPPSSMVVKPIFPSRATATLGGVVEETSPVKFWVISMEGTTGTGIGRAEGDEGTKKQTAKNFRTVIETTGLTDGIFAQINRGINKVVGIADRVVDTAVETTNAITDGNFLDGAKIASFGVKGAINDSLTPPTVFSQSAVDEKTNGFKESQDLMKFFYMYQTLKSKSPKRYFLYFSNIQTDQTWRVLIKNFSLSKNSQNPTLWKYKIDLQAWDVKPLMNEDRVSHDRFAYNGDLREVNAVNVAQLPQLLNRLGKKIGSGGNRG